MLTCFGGLENNSLTYLINNLQNQTDKENNSFENIRQTSYVNNANLDIVLNMLPGDFSILSLSCQSLTTKADSLKVLIENINRPTRCKLSAICLQETWLSSESDTSLFELHGYNFVSVGTFCSAHDGPTWLRVESVMHGNMYNFVSVGTFCSAHSGLGIYISDDYNFKVMNMHEQSMLWDGMFVEISGQSLNDKKIMLVNIYRPPRYIIDDYNTFSSELVPILTQLNKSKSEVVIAGDFNLDLLKLNENNSVSNFFDIITSQMFHPTITLPTRFSDKRCTLIDNCYCKYSPAIMNSTTGILTNNISDHQPYILNIHNLTTKVNVKKICSTKFKFADQFQNGDPESQYI